VYYQSLRQYAQGQERDVDQELKQAIGQVTAAAEKASEAARVSATAAGEAKAAAEQATSAANGATQGLQELRNLTIAQHQTTSRSILALNRNLGVLWKRVHGPSDPPPALDADAAPVEVPIDDSPPPLSEQVQEAYDHASGVSMELQALESRVIVGFAASDRRSKKLEEEMKKQSDWMGIGLVGLKWVGSREGAKAILTLIAAIGALYAAFRPAHVDHATLPAQVVYVQPPATVAVPLAPASKE
jgi:hypothetical protein